MKKRPIAVEDLERIIFVGDPQISPNGEHVLFSHKTITKKKKYLTHLFSIEIKTKSVKQWTQSDKSASNGRWSPDGSHVSFVTSREKPSSQFYLIPTSGGEAHKLSNLPEGSVGDYSWSPDGKWLAFTFRETGEKFTEKATEKRKEEGFSKAPVEIDSMWYRMDGDGYFGNERFKLYLLNVKTGKHKLLYSGCELGAYDFSWAPDSKSLAVVHPRPPRPLAKPSNDQLFIANLKGEVNEIEGQPKGSKSCPRFSPDASKIAYFANIDDDDSWGTRNTRILVVDAKGGKPKTLNLDDEIDFGNATLGDTKEGAPTLLNWAPDGSGLYATRVFHGEEQLAFVPLKGQVETLTQGQHVLLLGNLSSDGTCIPAIRCIPTAPGEVVLVKTTKSTTFEILTQFNKQLMEEIEVAVPKDHWIQSTDSTKVHTWVIMPKSAKKDQKVPVLLNIHGGPHAQYGWTFFFEFQLYAAKGYAVVYCNPRGSKGYGEKFCMAILHNWGEKDWQDIEAVKNWMQAQAQFDSARMGVCGGSYGGYMTNWVIGHTRDFKAAVTDRCVSNLVSMSGNSDFPLNPNGYFGGTAYGDLEDIRLLWKQSPIAYFTGVNTPTLVIHSEGDLRCNIEQSEQVFYALQMQAVPSRFVRYPVETSHGLSRTGPIDLRIHRLNEYLSWWSKWI